MTTIVYHHKTKTIAYDSRMMSGYTIDTDDYEKKIVCSRGHDWFCAGCVHDSELFINNFEEHAECEIEVDVYAIAVIDGVAYDARVHDGVYKLVKLNFDAAIGSGGNWAMAALDFGRKAKDAVKYAMTRDAGTGGNIRIYKLEDE